MTTGLYEDAIKAYTNSYDLQPSPIALYQRAKCLIALSSIEESYADLSRTMKLSPNDKVVIADKACLNAIRKAISKKSHDKSISKLTKLIPGEQQMGGERRASATIEVKAKKPVPPLVCIPSDKYKTLVSDKKTLARTITETIESNLFYKENIFNVEDFFLYRGILLFYMQKYNSAMLVIE
jgi:tetratricopeptide (TPR) repeat protein